MSVFVLSDLHLSHSSDKPMDIFGPQWENHTKKIFDNWQNTVDENDTVIIPGDISWGMNFGNTYEDLMFIEKLNGTKIIGKGNHDYWWQTQKKLNDFLHEKEIKSIKFLYNNAFRSENFIVCGTRSWFVESTYSPEDEKIVNREAQRLMLSLSAANALHQKAQDSEILMFLHYPPAYNGLVCEKIADVIIHSGVTRCFYGHLHSVVPSLLTSKLDEVQLYCVSADYIGFKPMKIIQKG